MKTIITLAVILIANISFAATKWPSDINLIRVYKSEHKLELVNRGNYVIKSYDIMLGGNPVGHKVQENDGRTPEGVYYLDTKNPKSKFFRSLHVSYPNTADKERAKALGVNPGGDIMIHGLPNDFGGYSVFSGGLTDDLIRSVITYYDWTNGCIAVSNRDMNEIYNIIDVPTKIVIYP